MKQHYLKLTVGVDSDLESPCDTDGWKLYSFGRRHVNYRDPNEFGWYGQVEDGKPVIKGKEHRKLREQLKKGYAFWLGYFEHGNSVWFRSDLPPAGVEFRWDGVRFAGLLIWEQKPGNLGQKTWKYEDRAKDADGFLSTYTAWANGEGCYYRLETDEGEDVGGCGGFYDLDALMEAVEEEIGEEYAGWPIIVEGDLADSVRHHHEIEGHEYIEEDDLEELPEPEFTI